MKDQKSKSTNRSFEFTGKESERLEFILSVAVGFPVVICVGRGRNDRTEWQIMPENEFESGVEEFWDWHAENNENWFATPLAAAADFTSKYFQFVEAKKLSRIKG